jgi:hypothetical protein
MDPVTAMRTGGHGTGSAGGRPGGVHSPSSAGLPASSPGHDERDRTRGCGRATSVLFGRWPGRVGQWKLSPQAQLPPAFGLSIVKPCFSMVSAKSIEAPSR